MSRHIDVASGTTSFRGGFQGSEHTDIYTVGIVAWRDPPISQRCEECMLIRHACTFGHSTHLMSAFVVCRGMCSSRTRHRNNTSKQVYT